MAPLPLDNVIKLVKYRGTRRRHRGTAAKPCTTVRARRPPWSARARHSVDGPPRAFTPLGQGDEYAKGPRRQGDRDLVGLQPLVSAPPRSGDGSPPIACCPRTTAHLPSGLAALLLLVGAVVRGETNTSYALIRSGLLVHVLAASI